MVSGRAAAFPGNRGGLECLPQNGPLLGASPRAPQLDARAGPRSLGPAGQSLVGRDRCYVKNLKLRPEQQARMDAIFEQNRTAAGPSRRGACSRPRRS